MAKIRKVFRQMKRFFSLALGTVSTNLTASSFKLSSNGTMAEVAKEKMAKEKIRTRNTEIVE